VANPGTLQIFEVPLLSQECVKLRTSNLADVFRESIRIKNLGENGAWAYTGSAQIFCAPSIISGTDKAAKLQIWQVYSQGPLEQKPFNILAENGAWAYPGSAQIF